LHKEKVSFCIDKLAAKNSAGKHYELFQIRKFTIFRGKMHKNEWKYFAFIPIRWNLSKRKQKCPFRKDTSALKKDMAQKS